MGGEALNVFIVIFGYLSYFKNYLYFFSLLEAFFSLLFFFSLSFLFFAALSSLASIRLSQQLHMENFEVSELKRRTENSARCPEVPWAA